MCHDFATLAAAFSFWDKFLITCRFACFFKASRYLRRASRRLAFALAERSFRLSPSFFAGFLPLPLFLPFFFALFLSFFFPLLFLLLFLLPLPVFLPPFVLPFFFLPFFFLPFFFLCAFFDFNSLAFPC